MKQNKHLHLLMCFLCLISISCGTSDRKKFNDAYFEKQLKTVDSLYFKAKNKEVLLVSAPLLEQALTVENKKYISIVYSNMSRAYRILDASRFSEKYADSAIKYGEIAGNSITKSYAMLNKTWAYYVAGKLDSAIYLGLQALELQSDNQQKDYTTLSRLNMAVAQSFFDQGNNIKTLEYINRSIEMGQKAGLSTYISALNWKNGMFSSLYMNGNENHYEDSMRVYSENCISLCQKYPDSINLSTQIESYISGTYYYTMLQKPTKAIALEKYHEYMSKCEELLSRMEVGDSHYKLRIFFIKVQYERLFYIDQIDYVKTLQAEFTKMNTDTINNNTLKKEIIIQQLLGDIYIDRNDYKSAYGALLKELELQYKNVNNKQSERSAQMEILFETEKKEAQIKYLDSLNQQKNYLIGACILASLALVSFLIYFKQNNKNKLNALLEEQVRQEAEYRLLKLEKMQIDKEFMSNQIQLKHKSDVLDELRLNQANNQQIDKILNSESVIQDDLLQSEQLAKEVHPGFVKQLNQHANGALTQLDIKYCTHIYLNMGTKQIASLLNVEAHSVRVAKYRIKQKLKLDKSQDLMEFLQNLV